MQAYAKLKKSFREEDQTETVAMADMDIVKISIVAWTHRKKMDFTKKFIFSSFLLSAVVIIIQVVILAGMDAELTDRMFCGDVVRLIEDQPGNPTNFFKDFGNDTHRYFKNLWNDKYLPEARAEIEQERKRKYESHYQPSCESVGQTDLMLSGRVKFYDDSNCTKELLVDNSPEEIQNGMSFTYQGLSQFSCKIVNQGENPQPFSIYSQCRKDSYSMNLLFDCGAETRIAAGDRGDEIFGQLNTNEIMEYLMVRCADQDTQMFIDMSKYVTTAPCSKCCHEYLIKYRDHSDPNIRNKFAEVFNGFDYPSQELFEENSYEYYEMSKKKQMDAESWLSQRLNLGKYTIKEDGVYNAVGMLTEMGVSFPDQASRFINFAVNFTNNYGACQQLILFFGDKTMYLKFEKPNVDEATLIEKPVYQYDFQFEQAEVYALTMERKKIEFVNQLALDWGSKITERAKQQCFAPIDSTAIQDVARCQSINKEGLSKNTGALNTFKKHFLQQSQQAIDNRFGFVKFFNDAIFQETVDKLHQPCNSTNSQKQFVCNNGFRSQEGSCLLKWNCSTEEWNSKICANDFEGPIFASTVTRKNMFFWIVSMFLLTFSLTCDCCNHLLYMHVAPPIFKVKLLIQVLISMYICMLNALLCAAQNTGFDMLMNSLGLLILNDLDDIIAKLFHIRSGITVEQIEADIHSRRDHFFSMSFAIPNVLWVMLYSLSFLKVFPIENPNNFIRTIVYLQFFAALVLIPIWYTICYLRVFAKCIDKCYMFKETAKVDEDKGAGSEMVPVVSISNDGIVRDNSSLVQRYPMKEDQSQEANILDKA